MATTSPKPSITDSHLQKYEEIMKTGTLQSGAPILPTAPASQTNDATTKQNGKIASILSSIPKPKGIGNKMFIFNGKKKIIMEGGEKEVENAKTIDAKEIKKLQKEEEKKEEKTLSTPPPPVKVEEDKEAEKKLEKKNGQSSFTEASGGKGNEERKSKKKDSQEMPRGLIFGGIALLIIWTAAWAYFLGYFSLLGL